MAGIAKRLNAKEIKIPFIGIKASNGLEKIKELLNAPN